MKHLIGLLCKWGTIKDPNSIPGESNWHNVEKAILEAANEPVKLNCAQFSFFNKCYDHW